MVEITNPVVSGRPVVNLAEVPLRDGGNGGKFSAKLVYIGRREGSLGYFDGEE